MASREEHHSRPQFISMNVCPNEQAQLVWSEEQTVARQSVIEAVEKYGTASSFKLDPTFQVKCDGTWPAAHGS